MVAEADILCQQTISVLDVQYLCVPKPIEKHFLDVTSTTPSPKPPTIFGELGAPESVSVEIACSESVVSCKSGLQAIVVDSAKAKFVPSIRSGSHTDVGCRQSNEDEHICVDDLSACYGYLFGCPLPSAFYAVFDGHGGSNAASFVKENAMKLFFEDAYWPQTSDIDDEFLEKLESSHHEAFLQADQALAGEWSVPDFCGTTALTALVLGRHLSVANAGDCRAVLCRKGVAVQMSHDHRPCYSPERRRIEGLGGYIEYGYLNGDLAVTRALGDWYMKSPFGSSASPLTAEPEVQQIVLTEDDEFLIIACDGIWDVMSNEDAVCLVRCALRRHGDPRKCARELVNEALRLNTSDNLTAIVVCFASPVSRELTPQRPRLRCCSLSEEARNRLRSLLERN